jgi:hypothetical protein
MWKSKIIKLSSRIADGSSLNLSPFLCLARNSKRSRPNEKSHILEYYISKMAVVSLWTPKLIFGALITCSGANLQIIKQRSVA